MKTLTFIVLCALLITGNSCRVGSRYEPPCTMVSEEWKTKETLQENSETTYCCDKWWHVFGDETLNELEERAIGNSPNLYIALQRIYQARAQACVAGSVLYPQINLDPSFSDSTSLFKMYLPSNLPSTAALGVIPPYRVHQFQYNFPINLNYEIDLWGKLRDRYDSERFYAEAQSQAYCTTLLTLTTDCAAAYFQLKSYDAEIDLFKSTIETRQKNLKLTQSRYQAGLINYLDVTQAQVDLSDVEANYEETIRLRGLQENTLAYLCGAQASDFSMPHMPLKGNPPIIPSGIPSTVLLQRPDIAEAEREMASEHALVNAAYAEFFPSFSLTGSLGYLSPDIKQFFKWISRSWMIGANASQVVFDGGRDYCTLQAETARFREASGNYQNHVIIALKEVEDALISLEQQTKESEKLQNAVIASKKATDISTHRYVKGVAIYLEVVENERLALDAEVKWVDLQGLRFISTVQLIKALGGSWNSHET